MRYKTIVTASPVSRKRIAKWHLRPKNGGIGFDPPILHGFDRTQPARHAAVASFVARAALQPSGA
jgi:hypothetical protein